MDNLAEGKQEVMVNGKPRHVLGYLQDFLFHPETGDDSGAGALWRGT